LGQKKIPYLLSRVLLKVISKVKRLAPLSIGQGQEQLWLDRYNLKHQEQK